METHKTPNGIRPLKSGEIIKATDLVNGGYGGYVTMAESGQKYLIGKDRRPGNVIFRARKRALPNGRDEPRP